ncbi:hypothetical protein JCM33374_g806 [Metschnikowia sp. JCM 33374]|nr:hypothetical protein JCM33374_g806 [Metschnikowia sp. JCM 33374]
MLNWYDNASQGWYLTTLSSLLCVLGCFIIFLDDIYYFVLPKAFTNRFPFHLKENYAFMNGSLAFSCGCLLLTALYRLLPEAMTYLAASDDEENANTVLIVSFIGGILTCMMFNYGMHLITTESVVHCSHDGDGKIEEVPQSELHASHGHGGHDHSHHKHAPSHAHGVSSSSSHSNHNHDEAPQSHDYFDEQHQDNLASFVENDESAGKTVVNPQDIDVNALESQPLLKHKKSSGLVQFLTHGSTVDESVLGECKGYTSAERCVYDRTGELHYCEIPQLRKAEEDDSEIRPEERDILKTGPAAKHHVAEVDSHSHHVSDEHHHHHVNSPFSRLLLIGIQTIFAITLHKLPEGFITYITSETNPQLGFSIFLSLLIHNYTEGFSMCLPLYYSFGDVKWRKLKAVSISATLGGLSQPLGAFLGYLFMGYYGKDKFDVSKLNYVFGVSMAVTSGFLVVIALSMYGSSVSFSARPNFVLVWCLIGMGTIGISTIFTSH